MAELLPLQWRDWSLLFCLLDAAGKLSLEFCSEAAVISSLFSGKDQQVFMTSTSPVFTGNSTISLLMLRRVTDATLGRSGRTAGTSYSLFSAFLALFEMFLFADAIDCLHSYSFMFFFRSSQTR